MKRLSIIGLLSIIACDPLVEMENIPVERLLSVSCFISPQDTVYNAYIFRGSPLGSTIWYDSAAVKDAIVTISDGENYDSLFLTFETNPISKRKVYRYSGNRQNVTISANTICYLNIETTSGETVTASCTIPPGPGDPKIEGSRRNNDFSFQISWNNPALHPYFVLVLDADGTYPNPYPGGAGKIEIRPSLLESADFPSANQVEQNSYDAVVPNAYIAENPVLKVTVRNIDEGLFQYFKTYQEYEQWDANNSGNIFPNFQELPVIYSNISGGVGVFGGYNQRTIEIAL